MAGIVRLMTMAGWGTASTASCRNRTRPKIAQQAARKSPQIPRSGASLNPKGNQAREINLLPERTKDARVGDTKKENRHRLTFMSRTRPAAVAINNTGADINCTGTWAG
jgi:hypothetical protein